MNHYSTRTLTTPRGWQSGLLVCLFMLGCGRLPLGRTPSGEIHVTSSPPGAIIVCDGVTRDTAPTVLSQLQPGTHLLIARMDGHHEARKTVSVLPGQKTVADLTLEPIQGLVLLHSEPDEAETEVDGAYRGKTPLLITDFPLGTHRVRFTKEGYLPREIELTVENRIPLRESVSLVSDRATLTVSSDPEGAVVTIDGTRRGLTPCVIPQVPTGEHVVQVSLEDHFPHTERITLKAEDRRVLRAVLKPEPSGLTVMSDPEGARVYLDNQYKGTAPLTLDAMPAGTYRLRADHPGYETSVRTVTLGAAEKRTEELRLIKNSGLLVVVTEPPGVKVFVDGKLAGATASAEDKPVSDPLQIDLLSRGQHTLQLSREGYWNAQRTVTIEADKVVSLHETLTRRFIPDTIVRTGEGAGEVYRGVLIERHPNGDVELEVKPGVIVTLTAAEIQSVSPIRGDQE